MEREELVEEKEVAWIFRKIRRSRIYIYMDVYIHAHGCISVLNIYIYVICIYTWISTVFSHFDTRFTLDEGLVGVNSQGRNWPGSS